MNLRALIHWLRKIKLTPMKIGVGFLIGFPLGIILASHSYGGLIRIVFGLALGIAFEIAIYRYKQAQRKS